MATDDLVRAIGEVAIEASYLEYCVAVLVSHANGYSDASVAKILSQVGGPLHELRALLKRVEIEKASWADFHHALARLEHQFSAVLDKRNKLIHSVETLQLSSGGSVPLEPQIWHPKTGDLQASVTVDEVHELTAEMRGIGGWFLRRMHTADLWASKHQPPSTAKSDQAPPAATVTVSDEQIARAAAVVRAVVSGSSTPVRSTSAAQAVLAEIPHMRESNWGGAGRFGDFVDQYVSGLVFIRRSPGYIYDPARHSEADLPNT